MGHHCSPARPRDHAIARLLIQRLGLFAATLLLASAVVFVLLDLLPGNAAQVMLGESATPEAVRALETKMGLDRPAPERYVRWALGFVTGDLGTSASYDEPIAGLIVERLAVTLPLALLAMVMATLLALAAGLYAAARHGRPADLVVMGLSQLGLAVPNFWLGILLVLLFSVTLGWFPAGGFPGWTQDEGGGLVDGLQALLLPALALASVQAAILARFTRSAVLEVLREDFVRTARAKGLAPGAVLRRHVLRNALVPIVTVVGLQFANLVTGTVVIENVFALPGLGRLVFQAIGNRDLPLVQAIVMLLVAAVVTINLAVDLLYGVIDPRMRRAAA